jgi:broad specificity phosphatase PhoE
MSVLTIVRHGQASLFASNYDQLSPVGEEQGRRLGKYWANQRLVIDDVYTGPRVRQKKSAELAGGEYQSAGLKWPEPVVLDDLDEYDLDGLANRYAPRLAKIDAEFSRLVGQFLRSEGELERARNFQRMFEAVVRHWQANSLPDVDVESWTDFRRRVERVIRRIQERTGRGKRAVLFTSGGFIGCAVQQALGVSDQTALELNWRIRNSSLTEFVFTPERFTLDGFNMIPHLDDPALWTYR